MKRATFSLMLLSSTSRMRKSFFGASYVGTGAVGTKGCAASRLRRRALMENQNNEPSPGRLITPMPPPINSVSRFEMARPKPVPPNFLGGSDGLNRVFNRLCDLEFCALHL